MRTAARFLALLIVACTAQARMTAAAAEPPSEYAVKAAFLYSFARFVEWPRPANADPDEPLVIGILGTDPFGPLLDEVVVDKTAGGRPLKVQRLARGDSLSGVHILFVADSERDRVGFILSQLSGRPVLTVSDIEMFTDKGGMIGLFLDEAKVRFAINANMASRVGLALSSRLLALARIVNGKAPRGR